MKEFIICAAIMIPDTSKIYYGHRHNHCFRAINDELSWTMNRQEIAKVKTIQGFITSNNEFVRREEALAIALENEQVLDLKELRGNQLYSEDLY